MSEREDDLKHEKAMIATGLTDDQVTAIFNLIEYKNQGVIDYLRDIELQDVETKMLRLLKGHGHVGDRVLVPI